MPMFYAGGVHGHRATSDARDAHARRQQELRPKLHTMSNYGKQSCNYTKPVAEHRRVYWDVACTRAAPAVHRGARVYTLRGGEPSIWVPMGCEAESQALGVPWGCKAESQARGVPWGARRRANHVGSHGVPGVS